MGEWATLLKQRWPEHNALQESAKMPYKITNYEYLKSKLAEVAGDDLSRPWSDYPCLLWERGINNTGHPMIYVDGGRHTTVARAVYAMASEPDRFVRQKCKNLLCFRPSHLFTSGTQFPAHELGNLEYLKQLVKDSDLDDATAPWDSYPCILWKRYTGKKGYGAVLNVDVSGGAHVLAYEMKYGEVPPGLFVCHRCDVPACVRWSHLFIGSVIDNNRDMKEKGRNARGQNHNFAKLTESSVLRIRELFSTGMTQSQIHAEFPHLAAATIHHIVRRKTWVHI
jgi:hypothetical protein